MNVRRKVTLAYGARDLDNAKETIIKRCLEAARMLREHHLQKVDHAVLCSLGPISSTKIQVGVQSQATTPRNRVGG